ncbi:hypothetical protein [Dactylosporangium sp. NPDC048998]|uniref:hypothetical protein n=1 Tax=Dactylosporangium sp. NPDC048998 TaxID=3363976 RepID=UPI0037214936
MSRPELADTVNAALDQLYPGQNLTAHYVDSRWIGKLERGEHRWPSRERRAALRHVLHVRSDAELGLFSTRRSGDRVAPPRRPELPRAAASGEPANQLDTDTPDTAEAWLLTLDQLTTQARRGVSAELVRRVRNHLSVLDDLQRDDTRPDLAAVDGRWSEFMSWLADNAGEPDGAEWLARSQRHAAAAGDQALGAYALMRHSQHALDNGDVRTAITLARRSLTHGPVPARTQVLCLTRTAEALAASGDNDTHTVITAARHGLRQAGIDPVDQFASHCDLRYVTAVDARCRQLLGDPSSAVAILEELLTDSSSASIDAGMWHAHLGECYQFDDPERAACHGMAALQLGATAGSYRTVRALQPLAVLLRRHRNLTAVETFINAHRQAMTAPVAR